MLPTKEATQIDTEDSGEQCRMGEERQAHRGTEEFSAGTWGEWNLKSLHLLPPAHFPVGIYAYHIPVLCLPTSHWLLCLVGLLLSSADPLELLSLATWACPLPWGFLLDIYPLPSTWHTLAPPGDT